jgi:hypothetical protein
MLEAPSDECQIFFTLVLMVNLNLYLWKFMSFFKSWLKAGVLSGLWALLAGHSAMAQTVVVGSLNSQCSNPVNLYTFAVGRDPQWPDLQTPLFDGDILKEGEQFRVVATTGIWDNVPHVPGCAQTVRLTHASNYIATGNPVCGSSFFPAVGIGSGFGCLQTSSTSIETRTIAGADSGETRVAWGATIKATRLQCLEQVPITVGVGYEKQSFTFWLKNDYIVRKGRWAKCTDKDWSVSSSMKTSSF